MFTVWRRTAALGKLREASAFSSFHGAFCRSFRSPDQSLKCCFRSRKDRLNGFAYWASPPSVDESCQLRGEPRIRYRTVSAKRSGYALARPTSCSLVLATVIRRKCTVLRLLILTPFSSSIIAFSCAAGSTLTS